MAVVIGVFIIYTGKGDDERGQPSDDNDNAFYSCADASIIVYALLAIGYNQECHVCAFALQ